MTYLLAAGDSWTDADFISEIDQTIDCSFPKWPEVLGKQLGISKIVNVGRCGGSNDLAFARCYDRIIIEKPKLVCILLSGWDRRSIFNYELNTFTLLQAQELYRAKNIPPELIGYLSFFKDNKEAIDFSFDLWKRYTTVASLMDNTLRNIFLFQSFCEHHKINYLIMQGLKPVVINEPFATTEDIHLISIDNYLKHIINSQYVDKFKESTLLGWPFFREIGGYSVEDKFYKKGYDNFKLHEFDYHPNALGHQLISDTFYKGYKNIYGKIS